MKTKRIITTLLLAITMMAAFFNTAAAKSTTDEKLGAISGKVLDAETKQPIEYANIRLFSLKDSSMITGAITSADGVFSLNKIPVGDYYIEISFIGFDKMVKNLSITKKHLELKLDDVVLSASTTQLNDVTVVGEKTHIKYEIDKQVVNPGKDVTSGGGTAVEVLENTPSVQVDSEGNVLLRGSTNYTVLINGKPTSLSGADALRQVPAESIDKIELITNPSAKYEAEGVSGIINILTKKNALLGFNGLISSSVGNTHKYSTNATFNYKKNKLNVFTGVEYADRYYGETITQSSVIYGTDDNYYQNGSINSKSMNDALVFKLGFDYDINDKNTLSIEGKGGHRGYDSKADASTNSYSDLIPERDYRNSYKFQDVYGDVMEYNLDYKYKIGENHELSFAGHYDSWNGWDAEHLEETNVTSSENNIEHLHDYKKDDFNYGIRLNADYVRPLGKGKLEAGYQFNFTDRHETFNFYMYDPVTGEMAFDPEFYNKLHYYRYIHAGYVTYSNEFKGFKYKIGLRTEYTDRHLNIDTDVEETEYVLNNEPDWFPSVHISRDFKKGHSIQASYSRRITRPNSWILNDNPHYFDANNIFYGSPYLLPQYTDSYELNYRKAFEKVFLSAQTYYRNTINGFTQERGVREGTTIIEHRQINSNRLQALGTELSGSIDLFKWLKINTGVNLFNQTEDGIIDGEEKTESNFEWNSYLNTTFKLKWGTRLQLNTFYAAPSKGLYGERTEIVVLNMGANQSFMKGKLNAGISARNVFNTLKFDFHTTDATGTNKYTIDVEGPVVMLNLSYRINNFKDKQRGRQGASEYSGGGF
jgi:outer membrane receptor protein involved in Fe transport